MAKSINPFQPIIDQIPAPFNSRYFIVLALFFIWLIFFDKHGLLTQYKLQSTLSELEDKETYYRGKIKAVKQDRYDLFTNDKSIEKFAREHYYMKKSDEDVFVITNE